MSRVVGPGLSGFAIVLLGLATTFGIAVILYAPLIVALALLPLESACQGKAECRPVFSKDAGWRQGGFANTNYFYRSMYGGVE